MSFTYKNVNIRIYFLRKFTGEIHELFYDMDTGGKVKPKKFKALLDIRMISRQVNFIILLSEMCTGFVEQCGGTAADRALESGLSCIDF